MGNFEVIAMFMVTLNILIFASQITMLEINPTGNTFCTTEGNLVNQYAVKNADGSYTLSNNSINEFIPDTSSTVASGGTLTFIDNLNSIITWVKQKVDTFVLVLKAPKCLFQALYLPESISTLLMILWYIISGLVLFAWIVGR